MSKYTLEVEVLVGHIERVWQGDSLDTANSYKTTAVDFWGEENVNLITKN
jgi:hypothetical protein